MEHEFYIILIPIVLCVMDVLSGYAAAMKRGELNSSVMREGLWNKMGEILAIALAKVCDFCLCVYGANFLEVTINTPLCEVVCGIVALYELTSVAENIGKISPTFGKWLIERIGVEPYKVGLAKGVAYVDSAYSTADSSDSVSNDSTGSVDSR